MKKIFTLFLSMVSCISLFATSFDFYVENEQGVKIAYKKYYWYPDGYYVRVACPSSNGYSSYSGNLIIPDKVEYNGEEYIVKGIDERAFYYTSNLESVTLPETITHIAEIAFDGSSIKSINLPISITSIGKSAFYHCEELTEINIPEGMTTLSENVFGGCGKLSSISIPNTVTQINYGAFSGCNSLEYIDLPDNLEVIGAFCFGGCTNLKEINFPTSLTKIGDIAFKGCSKIRSITIPENVRSVGYHAFWNCYNLQSFKFNAINCSYVGQLTEPAFEGTSLSSAEIGNNVKSIPSAIFARCKYIKSIMLPASVDNINAYSFGQCENLSSIYCAAIVPPTCDQYTFFMNDKSKCTIYVPISSIEEYKNAPYWKDFQNIVGFEFPESGINDILVDLNNDYEIYNINGCRIQCELSRLPKGVYIIRRGINISKIFIP